MIITLLKKEFTLELRRKSVISGLALYLFSTAFICYLTFSLKQNQITPLVWSALFWITILFTVINTIAKSFIGEKRGRDIYYYSIANPEMIILSKIIYNFFTYVASNICRIYFIHHIIKKSFGGYRAICRTTRIGLHGLCCLAHAAIRNCRQSK